MKDKVIVYVVPFVPFVLALALHISGVIRVF